MNVVTCAACGARIRADRERCLRCNQVLVAAPEPSRIQKLTSAQQRLMAGSAVLVLLLVGFLAWWNRPESLHVDAPALRPAAPAAQTTAALPSGSVEVGAASSSVAIPGEVLDLSRAA